jgi:hypothetical protein
MFKPKPKLPARLHFFFAREAPVGVIFRWGPRKLIRLILWHTDTDTFELGHWFKGKIYVDRANLSPDGKLLIYDAARTVPDWETEYKDSWIAISKPPYLTALTLWPIGSSYGGGGDFLDNQTVALAGIGWTDHLPTHSQHPLPPWLAVRQYASWWSRLRTRGWTPVATGPSSLHEKQLSGTHFVLRHKDWNQCGNRRTTPYELYDPLEQASLRLDAQQAEVDPSGRLILARAGKLFRVTIHPKRELADQKLTETELADFNAMRFEAIPPPEWATKW